MKKGLIVLIFLVLHLNMSAQNIYRTACQGNLKRLDSMLTNTTIDVKDNRGRSLLHWAVACKKKDIFDFLIQKGIKINGSDHQRRTPMHVAVQFKNEEYFDYLVNLQPDDNWVSDFGLSLLELAVLNKNKLLVERLIASGVDINMANGRGSTMLEISERIEATDISKLLISLGADRNLVRVFEMKGKYMGQEGPGIIPKMFAPNFVSTEEQEFGSVFNAEGTAFYFGVDVGGRNEIRFSEMVENQWTKPVRLLSNQQYSYNDPFLSNEENKLYFISKKVVASKRDIEDVDIWYIEKSDQGWSEPINAGKNINTSGNEYYISFTNTGTMYFSSNGHKRNDTTRTDHDIYYSKLIDNEYQKPVLLNETINTLNYEADVFISPDESYIIFCSIRDDGYGRGDLYISFKQPDGTWTKSINMGNEINTPHYEYCPFVTKDGKYLFYTSNQDIYWVSTRIINKIKQNNR